MRGELVSTITEDRLRLHGFLLDPAGTPDPFASAALILHGLAGNFYSSPLLTEIGLRLSRLGLATVFGNTRGHDFLNWTLRGGRTITLGAALEDVAECVHDVRAWVQFLARQGHRRVVVAGHSLGAIKALYAQAWKPSAEVVGLVAVSPTRLSPQQFRDSPAAGVYQQTLKEAERLVAAGESERLMKVEFPFPTWIGAAAYLQKYGAEGRFDWLGFIDRISNPTAIFFGQRELDENPAFVGLAAILDQTRFNPGLVHRETIADADHFYIARIDPLCERIEAWLAGQR